MNNITNIVTAEFQQVQGISSLHRSNALQTVNNESLLAAWKVGAFISDRLKNSVWGSKTVLTTLSNHFEILNACKTAEEQIFYVLYSHKERLNKRELQRCLKNNTFASLIGDKHNLSKGLKNIYPQITPMLKDTIFVDFLGLPKYHSEKRLQNSILDNMKDFILELGKDFLFCDKEYPVHVSNSTFKVDLLFFHRGLPLGANNLSDCNDKLCFP